MGIFPCLRTWSCLLLHLLPVCSHFYYLHDFRRHESALVNGLGSWIHPPKSELNARTALRSIAQGVLVFLEWDAIIA